MRNSRLHKSKVKRHIREHGFWQGWIVGSLVPDSHVNTGWYCGCRVKVHSVEELDKVMQHYLFYNVDYGPRVVCYGNLDAPAEKSENVV